MRQMKRTPRCEKCGWLGEEVVIDPRNYFNREEAEYGLRAAVLEQINRHLYHECEKHERWEYVPEYKCESCRQMIPLRDSNVMPEHKAANGIPCTARGRLPSISVVNGGAQGTGKRR